jgi:hypothetical protein
MAAKGSTTSDEVKAKISASQKARWDRIRAKVELGDLHEGKCLKSTDETFEHIARLIEISWPPYAHTQALNNPSVFQRFRNWINNK